MCYIELSSMWATWYLQFWKFSWIINFFQFFIYLRSVHMIYTLIHIQSISDHESSIAAQITFNWNRMWLCIPILLQNLPHRIAPLITYGIPAEWFCRWFMPPGTFSCRSARIAGDAPTAGAAMNCKPPEGFLRFVRLSVLLLYYL